MDRIHVDIEKPWLTVADICEYMDVSTFVVTSVLRTGELPAVKFGREWRISRDDFEDWINQQRADSFQPTEVDSSQFTVHSSQTSAADREPGRDQPLGD
jgi:excisionase family DNA binding protein